MRATKAERGYFEIAMFAVFSSKDGGTPWIKVSWPGENGRVYQHSAKGHEAEAGG